MGQLKKGKSISVARTHTVKDRVAKVTMKYSLRQSATSFALKNNKVDIEQACKIQEKKETCVKTYTIKQLEIVTEY